MKINASILIATIVAITAAGWVLSGQFGDKNTPENAPNTAKSEEPREVLQRVRVRVVNARDWNREVIIRGQTAASRTVILRAETAGRVNKIAAEEGSTVTTGQTILQIDPAERIAELTESRALLRQRTVEFKAARQLAQKGFRAETKLAEAQALLDGARSAVAKVRQDIERTTIRAPFDGVLEKRPVEDGDYVKVGDEIGRIVDLDPIYIVGAVSENEISRIALGVPARAILIDGRVVNGTVRFLGSVADQATRTFRMEVAVDNADSTIRDGLTSRITVKLAPIRAHFLSSSLLTLDDDGTLGIKALDGENKVRFLPVKVLSDRPDGVWLDGLPDKFTLITVGQGYVKAGQTVESVPENTAKPEKPS